MQPANIAEERIRQTSKFIIVEKRLFSNFKIALLPCSKKNVKRKKNKKNAMIMQGKESKPKREKNTTISFPLRNPEPITVPIITINAKILFIITNKIIFLKGENYDTIFKLYSRQLCRPQ